MILNKLQKLVDALGETGETGDTRNTGDQILQFDLISRPECKEIPTKLGKGPKKNREKSGF